MENLSHRLFYQGCMQKLRNIYSRREGVMDRDSANLDYIGFGIYMVIYILNTFHIKAGAIAKI